MSKGPQGFLIAGFLDTTLEEVTGCTVNGSGQNGFLIDADTNGDIKWAHCYDSSGIFFFADFTSQNEIWAVGYFDTLYGCSKLNDTSVGFTVAKLDSSGNLLCCNKYGSGGIDDISGVALTSDGGLLILTSFSYPGGDIPFYYGTADGFRDNGWLCKIDSAGKIQWSLVLGGSGQQLPQSVKEEKPGVYAALVNTTSTDYMLAGLNFDSITYVPWLITVDTGGHILDSKVVRNAPDGNPIYRDFSIPNANDIILVGEEQSDSGSLCYPGFGNLDFLVVDADSNYNYRWCSLNGGSNDDFLYYVSAINDSIIAVGGVSQSIDDDMSACSNYSDYYDHSWVGLYNLIQQKRIWQQCFCGNGDDLIRGVIYDTVQHELYLLVLSTSTTGVLGNLGFSNTSNLYLIKYTPLTVAEGIENPASKSLKLNVLPNPARDILNVRVANVTGQVTLKLIDLMGRVVAIYQFQKPEFQLQLNDLAGGMYLVQVTDIEGNAGVRKFVKE